MVCDRYILSSYVFHVADGVLKTVITRLNQGFPPPSYVPSPIRSPTWQTGWRAIGYVASCALAA